MGMERQGRFRSLLQKGFSFEEALHLSRSEDVPETPKEDGRVRLGVIGRPYYTYDPFLRRSIVEQIEERGYRLLMMETLSEEEIEKSVETFRKRIYWSFGKEIRGIVNLASFGCGQDSFNFEMIQNTIKGKIPILSLIFDEHLSAIGFSTRIEAFLEMVARGANPR
jgi:predicted nucleotide-binding protein (sugar kinase/HSP70/actin superfamily)